MSLVGFDRVAQPSHIQLKRGILRSLDLISYNLPSYIRSIVIKPNMCYYWDYSTGQTTDPKFVAALVDVIRDQISHDVSISIVESDASAMKCKHAFRLLGYEKLSKHCNVKLVNLSEDMCNLVKVAVGNQLFRLMVPQTIQNADLRINVTKLKYSLRNIKITCALKNIFGCNPYPKKFRYHQKLVETIVALNKIMKFDLSIVDGIIVSGVQPCKLGMIMTSTDSVALDAAAAKIAGVNPRTIKYLQLAEKEGLGRTSFIPKGASLQYFRDRYPRKGVTTEMMGKAYSIITGLGLNKRLGLE